MPYHHLYKYIVIMKLELKNPSLERELNSPHAIHNILQSIKMQANVP